MSKKRSPAHSGNTYQAPIDQEKVKANVRTIKDFGTAVPVGENAWIIDPEAKKSMGSIPTPEKFTSILKAIDMEFKLPSMQFLFKENTLI